MKIKLKNRPTPLSHREFKRNYEATANPRLVIVRQKAEETAKKIKKEGING